MSRIIPKVIARKTKINPKARTSKKIKVPVKKSRRFAKKRGQVKNIKTSKKVKVKSNKSSRKLNSKVMLKPAEKVKLAVKAIKTAVKTTHKSVTKKEKQILADRVHVMDKHHSSAPVLDIGSIKRAVQHELKGFCSKEENPAAINKRIPGLFQKVKGKRYVLTGIKGFDKLLVEGIPIGGSIIVAGGTGSGKTIFLLQTMNNMALAGKKCLYMSFEESPARLKDHMTDFGWDPEKLEKKGLVKIQRFSPFDITRSVEALLAKAKGELLIEVDPLVLPKGFKPDYIFLDSLTAIAAAFSKKEDSYRIYIEQLFRFFEKIGATTFLITETKQVPKVFSPTGVEEFLADGVIVLYSVRHENVKEHAIEILKLRGASHKKTIAAMQIIEGQGVVVYPNQEIFSELEEED